MLQIQMVIVGQDDVQIAALYSMIKEKVTDDKGKDDDGISRERRQRRLDENRADADGLKHS